MTALAIGACWHCTTCHQNLTGILASETQTEADHAANGCKGQLVRVPCMMSPDKGVTASCPTCPPGPPAAAPKDLAEEALRRWFLANPQGALDLAVELASQGTTVAEVITLAPRATSVPPTGTTPLPLRTEAKIVHILDAGLVLCGSSALNDPTGRTWPPGHKYVARANALKATCGGCLHAYHHPAASPAAAATPASAPPAGSPAATGAGSAAAGGARPHSPDAVHVCPYGHEQVGARPWTLTSTNTLGQQVTVNSGPVCGACVFEWVGKAFPTMAKPPEPQCRFVRYKDDEKTRYERCRFDAGHVGKHRDCFENEASHDGPWELLSK